METESLRTNDAVLQTIHTYSDMVYRLALARTKNKTDADDIFQEVFLRFVKNRHKITSDEHCRAWLIRTTVNCSCSFFSSPWKKHVIPLDDTLSFEQKEESDVYYATLELPVKYRTVIHLFYYEDMNVAEISQTLGLIESTVKSQLSRARVKLKTLLKGEYEYDVV